ncbi:MAG: alpha-glucan family phosphorylase [Acidobacteria bacterium]|nr:alpha-glucan family phosphorylase [Acidobacteriota bacterium]
MYKIAYFSMEIALDPAIPTYSGGLGVLAGDTLRAAADLGVPMAAVTLLHRKGYLQQRLDQYGNQTESPVHWTPEEMLEPMTPVVPVLIEGRTVQVRAWRYRIEGVDQKEVPVYLLDTALPENSTFDRSLTDTLYGEDLHYRLCQEVILGIGGVEMLRALGHQGIESYHMNEGHSALLTLALVERRLESGGLKELTEVDLDAVRRKCIFTTHTPVPAGHDQFPFDLVRQVLGEERASALEVTRCCPSGALNMTFLALRCSHYVNGVAMHHGEVSRGMFPRYPINAITNGVHALTWTCPAFRDLFDRHIAGWRRDNLYLRYAVSLALDEIRAAHQAAKQALLDRIRRLSGVELSDSVLTLGFARRAAAYKRATLLFSDPERLRRIVHQVGPLQVVYGGKAHPGDTAGKALIRQVWEAGRALQDAVKVVYVENYDMRWAQYLTSGVDLWLNTPKRPQEASGTSGMKAALNGVPSFSVLDGWWMEGHVEGVTGWSIGDGQDGGDDAQDAASLYDKLDRIILPMFYGRPSAFAEVMRAAIALNGGFFHTQRMVHQYLTNAYRG